MLHTDIQKQLQDLSLEDALDVLKLVAEQARGKASAGDMQERQVKTSLSVLDKYNVPYPKHFKFGREEANERITAPDRREMFETFAEHEKRLNFRLPPNFKFDREKANARKEGVSQYEYF